jgi:hypothetical protein
MVSAPPARSSGGLFKSPFPSDVAPPGSPPAEPRARPSAGGSGGGGSAAGDPRSQRPDLEVDWSHLERERAAIKARQEGDGRGSNERYAGPLIGANEVGRGQQSEQDQRDERYERDERAAHDRHAFRDGDVGGSNGYGEEGGDGRRSRRRDYEAERDRYGDGRGDDRADERRRRDHSARAGHAPARRYDDEYDERHDPRDRGGDAGYDERYDDQQRDRHDDRRDGRAMGQRGADRHARRDAARDEYDEPWNARDPATPAREEPGGGLWGDAPAEGDSAYYPAPAAAGRAPGKLGRSGKSGKPGKAGSAKPGRKSRLRVVWTVGSIVSSLAVFLLVRFELQHGSAAPGAPVVGVNSAQTFNDSLLTNKNGWLTNQDCVFKADGYHLTRGYLAYAPVADALNFDMWVQVKQTAGTLLAPYGLVFRRISLGNYYVFGIDGNGKWTFYKAVNNVGMDIVSYTASPAIKQGLNAQNTLEVKAHGTHFTFFVNGTQVGQADDTSLATKGSLGVAGHDDIEVVFTTFSLIRLA